jgi:hypothetical protein
MSIWHKRLPEWVSPAIWLIGIPATYYAIYHSPVGWNLAHGQVEALEEETGSLTAIIWVTVTGGMLAVRAMIKRQNTKKTEPNQSLQTTTMAVTDAAAQPPRQP